MSKALVVKLDKPNSIPGIHIEKKNQLSKVSSNFHVHTMSDVCTYTLSHAQAHRLTQENNVFKVSQLMFSLKCFETMEGLTYHKLVSISL